MRHSIRAILLSLILAATTTVYAFDQQQMSVREQRMNSLVQQQNNQAVNRISPPVPRQIQEQQIRESSASLAAVAASNPIPRPQTLSIESMTAPSDNIQPDAPAEYRYQPLQTMTIDQGERPLTEGEKQQELPESAALETLPEQPAEVVAQMLQEPPAEDPADTAAELILDPAVPAIVVDASVEQPPAQVATTSPLIK